jgi:hypothetical protein
VRATRQIDYGTSSVALFLGPRAKFLKSLKANVFLYATTASGRTAVRAILEANEVLRYYLPEAGLEARFNAYAFGLQ